ncbi:MAG TPA: SCE4755 family polysaccharide monooxygenase-like protein [Kofleriaceae bacterium]|nr:SCE4755 family polysaccharide monooxygenase-like protein [Kofleriaceae bacterium]
MRTLLILLLLSGTASAHITMTSPTPRTLDNKAGPCGAAGSTRGTHVATFAPGAKITVEWDETVDHPGHYRIAFDNDGDDVFVNPNNPNDNFPFTLMEPIADKAGGHYTQQVTLPMEPCENCTLQLMQIMTTQVPYNSFYYQCADIAIRVGGDPGGGSGGGGGSSMSGDDMGGCSTGSGGRAGVLVVLAGLIALGSRRARRR